MTDSDRIFEGLEKENGAAGDWPVYESMLIEDEKIRRNIAMTSRRNRKRG